LIETKIYRYTSFFSEEQYIMANNKKSVQRGCAKRSSNKITARQKRKNHSRSVKQRGGDLHKMYNYNNLQVDPQRMMTMDKGTTGSQTGGKGTDHKGTDHNKTDHTQTLYNGIGGKHRHSRKYYKRSRGGSLTGGALNFSAVENLVYKATVPMINNSTSIQTNMKVPAHV
jgi:hypothetical protein